MGIYNKILRKIKIGRRIFLSWYARHFMTPPHMLSVEETLDLVIEKRYSVSRNGDGELNLMMGDAIDFQHTDKRLERLLKEALNARIDRYLSCLPDVFVDCSRFNDNARTYFESYLRTKRFFYYHFAQAPVYGDALISRFYIDFKDKSRSWHQVEMMKKIWENRDVVLVEGKDSRLGVNNDLFDGARSLRRILGPAIDAFDVYDDLMAKVKDVAECNALILLALGPTATVMAYELAKDGYWAVDIGHIDIEYEWMKMGVDHKVAVPGKYTNECDKVKLTGSLPKEAIEKYNGEIVACVL